MNKAFIDVFWVLLIVASSAAPGVQPALPERRVLFPFDYKGVALEDGFLRRQVEGVKAFYLAIPNDDLLHGFRKRAGKPAPGKELGGWYSADLFHIFGQIISGLSMLYAATGDTACQNKVNYLIAEWAKCIRPDGFFCYSARPKSPLYDYGTMVSGLVDAHLYAHNPHALQHLHRITEWARKNIDRARPCPTLANGYAGGWFGLSGPLYRAYLASGDPIYRDFGKFWEYTDYWNIYANKGNIFDAVCDGKPKEYHALGHVNTLNSAALAYFLTGKRHYLDTICNAYDFFQNSQCFATGGYGPNEHLFPPNILGVKLSQTHASFETQCGTLAAFQLCKHLISFTGDARYGDWIERLVYNGIGASIPNAKDGRVFYYSDYNPGGGSKWLFSAHWPCCAGTRPIAVADYCDLIYFKNKNGICVNLYTPSSLRFQANGSPVVLQQRTAFPEIDKVSFVVQLEQPVNFELKLRKPEWLKGPAAATINDKPIELSEDKMHWMTIQRTWNSGDRLQIQLQMSPMVRPLPSGHSKHFAVSVGPVVLAAKSDNNPSAFIDPANLEKCLFPVSSGPLAYRVADAQDVILKPFYQFALGEKYFMYLTDQRSAKTTEPVLRYVPGSTIKLEQLVGEMDKERHQPTRSRTFSRYGVLGTDLGYSFEHKGRVYFLFGDTMGRLDRALDTIATTDARDPERGVRLDFLTVPGRPYLTIEPPGISMGAFETPVGGISLGGNMYVVVRTNHSKDWSTDRSVLTKFTQPAKFQPLRTISQSPGGRFITQSLHIQPKPFPGLPPGGPFVIILGTAKYRGSDAYLLVVPAAHFETGQGTRYFAGLDAEDKPTWSARESDARPIVENGTLGDLSVTWCKDLDLWLMTYDRRAPTPTGAAFSYSRTPWGPWSEPQVLFTAHDGAKFMHNPRANPPDGLAGPVIGKPEKDWAAEYAGAYAPYVVERFTKVVGSELHLYYCLSTWNPYVVVLMKSRLQVE